MQLEFDIDKILWIFLWIFFGFTHFNFPSFIHSFMHPAYYLSIYLFFYLFIYLYLYLSIYQYIICLSVNVSIYIYFYLSIYLCIYLSIYLSIYLYIYLYTCLFICLYICFIFFSASIYLPKVIYKYILFTQPPSAKIYFKEINFSNFSGKIVFRRKSKKMNDTSLKFPFHVISTVIPEKRGGGYLNLRTL